MKSEYLQDFEPTEKDIYLWNLAKKYYLDCERYDRTVCTGRIIDGSVMPASPYQAGLVVANALMVLRECRMLLAGTPYSVQDWNQVKKAYEASPQFLSDLSDLGYTVEAS